MQVRCKEIVYGRDGSGPFRTYISPSPQAMNIDEAELKSGYSPEDVEAMSVKWKSTLVRIEVGLIVGQ